MSSLRGTVARLAAGSRGRTEADIQSDVRGFLLDAPLDLSGEHVIDVGLEAQVSGGGRIDVEAGCAAIEVKKSLASKTAFEAAVNQLADYVRQRTEELEQRYVGVLTDGQTWVLFHLDAQSSLQEVSRFKLEGAGDAGRLAAWLEPVLATTDRVKPTPKEIVRRLGADSPGAQLDLADLRSLYFACRGDPEVQLKRQLWARLLLSALGTNFQDSDELFVTHTYLVLAAELIAYEVMGIPVDPPGGDFRGLLEGHRFAIAGLHGVVEADFFDWPATIPQGGPVIAGIARRVATFEWSEVDHDVLKALYESVIDSETRHRLGEYYTPDWLAQKLVDQQFSDPLAQRLLDPACGSGTFLFWAVRRLLAACDKQGIPNRDALERVVSRVQGMDLHPVAVILARVTYLLALTPERLADRNELTVPVFLGDSVRWEHDDIKLGAGGITVRTSDELELIEDELHFPEAVVEEPARFDRLVADLASRAAKRRRGTKPPSVQGILNLHKVAGDDDRDAITTAFHKLCRLHDNSRDHLWSYYIRNRARPLVFTRPDRRADVLVGNPPWLAYRSMSAELQERYRTLAEQRGLWAGGKVATHQDLSDLFVARAIELYLKPGGQFSFVMPYAALSRRQFAGFRTGEWTDGEHGTRVQLARPEEFARVKPPPFQVPASVVLGVKASPASPLPTDVVSWRGYIPNHQLDWPAAAEYLSSVVADVASALDAADSPYRSCFRQGASLVPRMLLTVEPSPTSRLGVAAGRIAIRSARSANEKKPWKHLESLAGVVERHFVRPMHVGATIVAFRPRDPQLAIVPWAYDHLMDGTDDHLDEYPGVANWWREAEHIWNANKTDANRLTLGAQIDFQSKLTRQFPIAGQRVVYTKSGQHLAACRIEDSQAVIDHTLYWSAAETIEEARYLCAVLNSQALSDAVIGLQARGQHNPRHFDMHIFALPFPTFDGELELHSRLAKLAADAEHVAAAVDLDPRWQFQKARRVTRDAIREHGVATEIDAAVSELASVAAETAGVPDLMTVIGRAAQDTKARQRGRTSVGPVRTPSRTGVTPVSRQ